MKATSKIISILSLALGILLAGCSDDDVSLKDITLDKSSMEVIIGYRAQITALPVPLDASDQKFEWASDNPSVATVTQFGIVEAVTEGTANVSVTKGSITKTVPVTVVDPVVIPARIGQWLFDDPANLVKAETGNNLSMTGDGFASVDGPAAGNQAVRIAAGSHFRVKHNIQPESGETLVHRYTLLIDFKVPSLGPWYAFYQTEMANTGDADLFINSGGSIGVGTTGYAGTVTPGKWQRLIVCADLPDYKYYLDGELINSSNSIARGDRFSLDEYILLICDNDGEDAEMDVAEITIWAECLDELQVNKLGVIK